MSAFSQSPAPSPAHGLLCPSCRVDLVMSERQGIEIDYCPKCRGVWLDRGELDKIIARSMAEEARMAPPPPPPPEPRASFFAGTGGREGSHDAGSREGHGRDHGGGHGRDHGGGWEDRRGGHGAQGRGGKRGIGSFLGDLFD